jgi:hypothetical protein
VVSTVAPIGWRRLLVSLPSLLGGEGGDDISLVFFARTSAASDHLHSATSLIPLDQPGTWFTIRGG